MQENRRSFLRRGLKALAVAGAAAMSHRSFTSANIVGALPWAVGLPLIGYYAYRFPALRTVAYVIAGAFVAMSLASLVFMLIRDARRRTGGAG